MTVSGGRPVILRQAGLPAVDVHPITGKLAIARIKKEKWKKHMRHVPPALAPGFQPLAKVIKSLDATIGLFDASPLAHETYANKDQDLYSRMTVAGLLAHFQLVRPGDLEDGLKMKLQVLVKNAQTRIFCDPFFGMLVKLSLILRHNPTIKTLRVYFEGATADSFAKSHAATLRQQDELRTLLAEMQGCFNPSLVDFGLQKFDHGDMCKILHGFGRALVTAQAMAVAITEFDANDDLDLNSKIVCVTAPEKSENDHQLFVDLVALAAMGLKVFLVTNDNDLLRYWRPRDPARAGIVVYTDGANNAVALMHAPGSAKHLENIRVSRDFFKTAHGTAVTKVADLTAKVASKYATQVSAKTAWEAAKGAFDAANQALEAAEKKRSQRCFFGGYCSSRGKC